MFTGTLSPEHNPTLVVHNMDEIARTQNERAHELQWQQNQVKNGHSLLGAAERVLGAMETSECRMPTAEAFLSLIFFRRTRRRRRISKKETFGTEGTPACRTCTCTRNLFCFQCSCENWWKFHSIGCPMFLIGLVAFRRAFYRKLNVKHWIWMISTPPPPWSMGPILFKRTEHATQPNGASTPATIRRRPRKKKKTVFLFKWNGAIECVSAQCCAWMCACVVLVSSRRNEIV